MANDKDFDLYFGWLLLALFIAISAQLMELWVGTKLWQWYIVPTFDVPQIGMSVVFGVWLFVIMFRQAPEWNAERSSIEKLRNQAISHVIRPFILLGFGLIGTLFMG